MQRDIELLRQLLLDIEPCAYPNQHLAFHIEGYDPDTIAEHMRLLVEAGFIQAADNPYSCFYEWNNIRLTWAGHEFLELARQPEQWATAKQQLAKTATQNITILQEILLQQVRKTL